MTASPLQELGAEIWEWRTATSFRTSDDIPRLDHDPAWLPRFDAASVEERRSRLDELMARLAAIDVTGHPVPVQVDHRLLGSALARVRWDLDVVRSWEKDAVFLAGQILGPWFDLLLPVPPFSVPVQHGLVAVLRAIPAQVEVAKSNLQRAGVSTVAVVAAEMLSSVEQQLAASVDGLEGVVDDSVFAALRDARPAAIDALGGFARWLVEFAPTFASDEPVGRDRFIWYLRNVALIAEEPEELVRAAEQDYRRAVVAETITRNRYRDIPPAPIAETIAAQVQQEELHEQEVRDFYERHDLLTQPESLGRYLVAAMPAYLEPLQWLGVTDDLTSDGRLDIDSVSYMPDPHPELSYFYSANARDPRLGIVHEGAHYKQLALAWAHENPIRRRYYDSVANEGVAFYNEEMMLTAGLFEDAPHSQVTIHNFNRLRSLRVIADVSLATGEFSHADAVELFVTLVPMDQETAVEESAMYVATPGLAMSYHVGKQQVLRLMTDAIRVWGDEFSVRRFHDAVWLNGNVPFSLQRWELLGDRADIDVLDAATASL